MASWYVRSTGTDDAAGGRGASVGDPFETVNYAISRASSGDTIYIVGTLHQLVDVGKAGLTFKSLTGYPTGLIDGEFTLPTTTGGSTLVNPKNGTPSYYSSLVSITANNTVWDGVNITRSKGRCIVVNGTAANYRTGVVIKNSQFDYANNAVLNVQYTDGIIIQNVKAYRGDWYYQEARVAIPGSTNWAVAFNILYSKNAYIKNCVSAYSWGEGMAFGRNTVDSIIEDCVIHDNYSVGFYVHRCQRVTVRRCLLFHTHSSTPSSRGVVVQNEDNFPGALEAEDNLIEDCISIGHTRNFQIAGNETSGASIRRVKLLNCTGINARGPNGVSDSKGCLSIISNNHFDITIQGCIFYQDAGAIATVSGSLAAYTLGKNSWLGPGNVPAGLLKSTDVVASMVNPDATLPLNVDTLTTSNYALSAQKAVGLISGADTLDYNADTRTAGSVGAIEYGGTPTPDNVSITSAATTNFVETSAGTFTVTTAGTGSPVVLAASGSLPSAVTFTDNGDGTATLAGTPAAAAAGNYPLTITASVGSVEYDSQSFLLTVTASTPTPSGAGAMAVARVRVNTSTGTQAITVNGLANPPSAALFILSPANADYEPLTTQTASDNQVLSVGAATASSEWAISVRSEDNQTTSNTARYSNTGRCIYLRLGTGAGALDCDALLDSFAQDTVTIDWQSAPDADYWLTVFAFDGTAYAGVHAINTTVDQKTTVNCSLTTTLGFVAIHGRAIPNTSGNADSIFSLGVFDGSLNQKSFGQNSSDAEATNVMSARIASNRVAVYPFPASGNIFYSLEASNIVASTSVDFYTRDGTPSSTPSFGVLLLELADGVYVGTQATASATGVTSHTGMGFTPAAVGVIASALDAVDAGQIDSGASSWGISGIASDVQAATAWYDAAGADPTNTKSAADDLALMLIGTDVAAEFSSFTADGVDLNYTLVDDGPFQSIMWAVEGAGAIPLYLYAREESSADGSAVVSPLLALTAREESSADATAFLAITDSVALELFAVEESEGMTTATLSIAIPVEPKRFTTPDNSTRLSIEVYEPLLYGNSHVGELSKQIQSYEHQISRVGGYWSATIDVIERRDILEDWYETGLGRRIVTRSPYGHSIWEGFVNQITLQLGTISVSVGPLLGIVNSAKLVYSYVDTSGSDALVGLRLPTDYYNDLPSQRKWGALIKVLSTGGATPETAAELVQEYVRQASQPLTTQDFSGSGGLSMRLDCLGYVHFLNTYPYNNLGTGLGNLSDKLIAALNAEPNNFITHEFGRIETNTLQEPVRENNDLTGWDIAKSLVSKGGADNLERLFGIFANRTPIYKATPKEISYYQYTNDPRQRILTPSGHVVDPWDVQPGKWLFAPDLLIGRVRTDDLENDPRAQYIENVRFRTPYEVVTEGLRVRRLDQRLARLGLSGIGG